MVILLIAVLLALLLLAVFLKFHGIRENFKKNVCIVMFGTSDIMRQYGDIAVAINRAYADRHGYALIVEEAPHPMKCANWHKVGMMRRHLPNHDAVVWIDSDAIFNPSKHGVSLDRLLASREDALVCKDAPPLDHGVNTGVLIFKNTPWSREFLDRWWAMRVDPAYESGFHEQAALNDMLKESPTEGMGIREAIEFNHIPDDNRRKNAFVIHLAGTGGEYRRRELGKLLQIKK